MNTPTKRVWGAMGALRPLPAHGDAMKTIQFPPPELSSDEGLLEGYGQGSTGRKRIRRPIAASSPVHVVVTGRVSRFSSAWRWQCSASGMANLSQRNGMT